MGLAGMVYNTIESGIDPFHLNEDVAKCDFILSKSFRLKQIDSFRKVYRVVKALLDNSLEARMSTPHRSILKGFFYLEA